jgi:transcriptional regulator with XRE-family HTH domain
MARTVAEMLEDLPAERRLRIEAEAEELIRRDVALRDLRRELGLTQRQLAALMDCGQDDVSRAEHRGDMKLSTLRRIVHAMGGELDLVVRLPDREPVRLALGKGG